MNFCTQKVVGLLLLCMLLGAQTARAVDFDVSLDVTAPAPATPASSVGGGNGTPGTLNSGAFSPFTISNIEATPGVASIRVLWTTNRVASGRIRWGKSLAYELGETQFSNKTTFDSTLPGLASDTDYFFAIELTDLQGNSASDMAHRVRTLLQPLEVPNVAEFRAIQDGVRARLTWQNPDSLAFGSVRVVRSEHFFPSGPDDGKIVYEGRGDFTQDADLVPGQIYFYTLFVIGPDGAFSTGAVTRFVFISSGSPPPVGSFQPPASRGPLPAPASLTIPDFFIREGGASQRPLSSWAVVGAGEPVTLVLPFRKYPVEARAVVVRIDSGDARIDSTIIFRFFQDRGVFEAVLPIFSDVGGHLFSIELLGQHGEPESNLSGALVVVEKNSEIAAQNIKNLWIPVLFVILFSIALFLAIFLRKLYTL